MTSATPAMVHSQVRYSRLSNKEDPSEKPFDFVSPFTYNDEGQGDYDFKNDYNSAFKYRDTHVKVRITDDDSAALKVQAPSPSLVFISWFLTFMSYAFFVLTAPFSYWFLVKKMGEFDRIVVFRLGKMIGVKGPGRFIIFPWMDRIKRIDVRASAFSVPPQQFITVDGGIVEMGAEIQYGIVDVVTMISEVADHQDILRSLGKTLLVKFLVKKTVTQLERDKRTAAQEILDEVNDQVRKWGINVQNVTLSEPKIIKQPESGSDSAVGSIMKGLGMKDEAKYPSPSEFVRATHGLDGNQAGTFSATSMLGASGLGGAGAPTGLNMNLLRGLAGGAMGGGMPAPPPNTNLQITPGAVVAPPDVVDPAKLPDNWGSCLEVILAAEFAAGVEPDAQGVYRLEITETNSGRDTYWIRLSNDVREVHTSDPGLTPDVSVVISSPDLASVLDGSLAPLQAYLTGRITANGDVRKLMFFDKLSKRGHKPGTMFSV